MPLGLGTVQFGQCYGVSNKNGQVSREEVAAILARAKQAGVRILDTAATYGQAETVLSTLDVSSFRVITKTIPVNQGIPKVLSGARQSFERLRPDTLLVHAASDLKNQELWSALQALKAEGLFKNIGISAYYADDPVRLAEIFRPDVLQIPFSILDQRLLRSGALARLKGLGIEVHARSIFLQGLLFLDVLPERLRHVETRLHAIRNAVQVAGYSPLSAALSFVLSRPEVDVALVGITSQVELEEILKATEGPIAALDWPSLALDDELVLTPSLW